MSEYESVNIERIKNGFLVHLTKADPEAWSPATERPKKEIMGMELDDQDTWYAKDDVEVYRLLSAHYFGGST